MNWSAIELVAAVFGGSFFGSFLGPLLLEEWRSRRHRRKWLAPRQELVREYFTQAEAPAIALDDIAVRLGCEKAAARDVLVEMGAAGTRLPNGQEAFYFDRDMFKLNFNVVD